MNDSSAQNRQLMEREGVRTLLILYDIFVFSAIFLFLFIRRPSAAVTGTASVGKVVILYSIPLVCIFGARSMFRVYHQILRYGNMGALARLLAADAIGGMLYIVLNQYILPSGFRTSFLRAESFVSANYTISTALRITYYYVYWLATQDTAFGKCLKKLLLATCGIDFNSKKPGAVVFPFRQEEPINDLQRIARQFMIHGEITKIEQMNAGYINRTYRVETLSEAGHVHKYTLQRINTNVFPDVEALMQNFILTTTHLRETYKLPACGAKGSIQTAKTTKDGQSYLRDDTGCWRLMTYFDDVYSLDIPDSPETFYHAGLAFGYFVKEMADVPVEDIKITIPNFHNTYSRYLDLEKAIAQDPVGRVKEVVPEIEFIRERKDQFGLITEALESGRIPTRICHNDCNLNNILFDQKSHLPVAVIDLDTVMPSSPLYDYGDSMRIGTNTALDDEKDLSKVSCDLRLYEAYARGYLTACGSMLTREELELLPYASLIITAEDGIRFLMDHINGDTYYHIYYTGQNLDRSRTQLALLADMEKKLPEIKEILRKIYKELNLKAEIEE